MKIFATIFLLVVCALAQAEEAYQTGDIIFQSSENLTNKAIELATHSKYSHVGVIVDYQSSLHVLEATQPVKFTPLESFIKRGSGEKYAVLRLKSAEKTLTDETKAALLVKGESWVGKNYDFAFSWSDEELYCSELVYKLYEDALHLKLTQPKPLKTFDLSHPLVKEQLRVKYGKNIPYNENMVSPEQIYQSDLLEPVTINPS